MKYPENINQLVDIQPDYMGFIFYPKSKRFMADSLDSEILKAIPKSIKKVGVFVNESAEVILSMVEKFRLDLIQLHGNESSDFCNMLYINKLILIKAFQLHQKFDFGTLENYKSSCQYFLFDTQTPLYGGSGHKFDWKILYHYDNDKPFFLSGGIDLEDAHKILNIKNLNIHAIDINSKFEIEPGMKNIEKVKKFKDLLTQ
ncbi:MAG: phosphoribosylanthranilate isomerase [Bacteroidales bacterium]|nr:phosphoribosylanthranilate isomerase [Bacteroidales bacterium]